MKQSKPLPVSMEIHWPKSTLKRQNELSDFVIGELATWDSATSRYLIGQTQSLMSEYRDLPENLALVTAYTLNVVTSKYAN